MKRSGFRFLVVLAVLLFSFACNSKKAYNAPDIRDGYAVINIAELKDATPQFFSLKIQNKRIDFFVLKLGSAIESYLDACIKCYPHKKGYSADGFYLVCQYCNVRYPLDSLKTGVGSCYPIPIQGELKRQEYRISLDRLRKAKRYF